MRDRLACVVLWVVGMWVWLLALAVISVPGVSCDTGVASVRMTNSLDCSGSLLLPSVNFTSGTAITYATGPAAPYNMPMLSCTRIRTTTDSTSILNITINAAVDVKLTCSPNGTWTLQAWPCPAPTQSQPIPPPKCDLDINPATPIWTLTGNNNTCVPANLTLWKGASQGSLSVTCFPTVYADEPTEQVGGKCRGATDCATVTLYSATSDDLSVSCSGASLSLIAPPDRSCQSLKIGSVSYSYRVGCTNPGGIGNANYDFTAWAGSSCEVEGGSSFHAAGRALTSVFSYDDNALAYFNFYALNQISTGSDNYCQPITPPFLSPSQSGLVPTFPWPQRITVACGGPNRTLGATVYTYEQPTSTATAGSGSGSACSVGSVRSAYVVPSVIPQGPTCHASDFTRNSASVYSELITCHSDGSFDLDLFTYDVDPTGLSNHCLDTYHNATIHGTSGQCIDKPTLAGPPQPVRIICNGPHLIPNNNTSGTGTGAGGGSGSGTSSTNTIPASTSTTASSLSSMETSGSTSSNSSFSSSSNSNSNSGSSSSTGSGSGSGNLPNGGFRFGSRYPCAAVMMVAWVGVYLIF